MKRSVLMLLMLFTAVLTARPSDVLRAMNEELDRNIRGLSTEDFPPPFFISYTYRDMKIKRIRSVLGTPTVRVSAPYGVVRVSLKNGDYLFSGDNYLNYNNLFSAFRQDRAVSGVCDAESIKRAFWLLSDEAYKGNVAVFEEKKSVFKERGLNGGLPDFAGKAPETYFDETIKATLSEEETAGLADSISDVFRSYPDIFDSYAEVNVFDMTVYYTDSEGSQAIYPRSFIEIAFGGVLMNGDGSVSGDVIKEIYPGAGDFGRLRDKADHMAKRLVSQKDAPVFDDYYRGPVMFTGRAAKTLIAEALFGGAAPLISRRLPVYADERVALSDPDGNSGKMEKRIGRKIISSQLTVTACPALSRWDGRDLSGSYRFDAEGMMPDAETILVENGMLRSLLNSRTPAKVSLPMNGHYHWASPWAALVSPGVIKVTSNASVTAAEAEKTAIETALADGYDYYIEVARLKYPGYLDGLTEGSGVSSEGMAPAEIYMVKKDGTRIPLRGAAALNLNADTLYNVIAAGGLGADDVELKRDYFNVPVSVISPDFLLLEGIAVEGERDMGFKTRMVLKPVTE